MTTEGGDLASVPIENDDFPGFRIRGDSADLFHDLASRVAGQKADGSLLSAVVAAGLVGASAYLSQIIHGETSWPSRVDWQNRLDSLEAAAVLLARELADPRMVSALETTDPSWRTSGGLLLMHLGEDDGALAALARQTRDRVSGGSGSQQRFELNPDGLSAQELCAAAVVAAWQWARDRSPGHTASDVHCACQALWDTSGGISRGGWGKTRSGWRAHLEVAKSERGRDARHLFTRFLMGARTRLLLKPPKPTVLTTV